jgi:hypothetical protein
MSFLSRLHRRRPNPYNGVVRLNLAETVLEATSFERIAIERSDQDWIHCWIEDVRWQGTGAHGT